MYVCTCASDCSDSSVMALQWPKHGRFNNTNYWELSIDTVFLLVNILKKTMYLQLYDPQCSTLLSTIFVTLNYAWQNGRTVPVNTQAEVLQTALMI
jgi:hypothetical protein